MTNYLYLIVFITLCISLCSKCYKFIKKGLWLKFILVIVTYSLVFVFISSVIYFIEDVLFLW